MYIGRGGFVVRGSKTCLCVSADMSDKGLDRLDSVPEGTVDKLGTNCEARCACLASRGRPPELYSLRTSSRSSSSVAVAAEGGGVSSDATGISPDSTGGSLLLEIDSGCGGAGSGARGASGLLSGSCSIL